MESPVNDPRNTQERGMDRPSFYPDQSIDREGGDDSLADASPIDPRGDEKVIVNEQREHKTVNAPSQTAVNTSERISNDEDTVDYS
jgi:hypothetical protein